MSKKTKAEDKAEDARADDKDQQAEAIREETEGQTAPATPLPVEEQDLAADSIKHDRGVKEAQDRQAAATQGMEEPPEAEGGPGNPPPQRGPTSSMGADGPDPAPRVKLSALVSLRQFLEGVVDKVSEVHDRVDDQDLAGRLRQASGAADNLLDAIRDVMGKRGVSSPIPPEGEDERPEPAA